MFQLLQNKHYQPFIVPSGSYGLQDFSCNARPWFRFSTQTSSVTGLALFLDAFTRANLVVCTVARTTKLRPEVHHQMGWVNVEDGGRRGLMHRKELGFQILIVSGIPDPLSCIPSSKAQNDERCRGSKEDR
ncbi:unnamed protein product [Porites lobata]|uniref:Uncharacterized protein n=1 Tax=Porites lobata TaxID=104759 RepID=A0ABN8RQ61_9CNID|nr:unnamed protein product [Porites lobata]